MTRSSEAPASAAARRGRVPDFFIVGHPKSGTTALYEMLRSHPQIHMPVKEPWFFTRELISGAVPRSPERPQTLEAYLALFEAAGSEQLIGEATPSYLRSHLAATSIAELCPDARIVAILREPAEFLRSFHLQSVQSGIENERDLRTALDLEPARREGRELPPGSARPEALQYSSHVRYVEQLRRYHEAFGAERVLVMIYEDFRAENVASVRRVLRFLGVDDEQELAPSEANPSVRVRNARLERLLRSLSLGAGPGARALRAT
ncbi:MAG: sulfotransferase, partial [Solirubrobacterales bacterium]|nr:sulfotransferase [Solirubrobacterales bacterium]